MSLQEARARMAEFDRTFKLRMAALREQESASLQAAIDREVYALADLGWSVSKIAREYGTTDWGTVKKILDRRVELPPVEQPLSVTKIGADTYRVTENGETAEFDYSDGFPWLINGLGTALSAKIRDDEEFLHRVLNSAV